MAITEVALAGSFLSEVSWARETITKVYERKIWSRPIGLREDTRQPDELYASFLARDLPFTVYCRLEGLAIGTPDAYTQNIGTIEAYIEKERQEEIRSVNDKINDILAFKSQDWSIGLSWPTGQPDAFARYFTARGLPIAQYLRGPVSMGEKTAYDQNIATLNAYVRMVGAAALR